MAENVNRALGATVDMRQLSLMPRYDFLPHSSPLTPNPRLVDRPLNLMLPGLEQQMLMVYSLDILSHHLAVKKTYVDRVHHTLSKLLMMGRIRQLLMI
jgi:hypothetical protein